MGDHDKRSDRIVCAPTTPSVETEVKERLLELKQHARAMNRGTGERTRPGAKARPRPRLNNSEAARSGTNPVRRIPDSQYWSALMTSAPLRVESC